MFFKVLYFVALFS